ncbi:MAG: DUF5615 family PIN-like protein [Acidobacteria bacterium]|nr:DUF5615 family PIN-like protein [Acidobacteriota bacterium]MBI3655600.1 DUF5615 family PIN-like protein [Acidobacteriota bacterium]
MKFLIDMPLSPGLADWLRQQSHDAVHALEIGLDRASDEVILKRAQGEQRVAITAVWTTPGSWLWHKLMSLA